MFIGNSRYAHLKTQYYLYYANKSNLLKLTLKLHQVYVIWIYNSNKIKIK